MTDDIFTIRLEIQTQHSNFEIDDVRLASLKLDVPVRLGDTRYLEVFEATQSRGILDTTLVFEIAISFIGGVTSSFVASWLFEQLKGKSRSVVIEGVEVTEMSEKGIKKIIIKKLEIRE